MLPLRCTIEKGIVHCQGRKIILNGCEWYYLGGLEGGQMSYCLIPSQPYCGFLLERVDKTTWICEKGNRKPPDHFDSIKIALYKEWRPDFTWTLLDHQQTQLRMVFLLCVRFGLDHEIANNIARHLYKTWITKIEWYE